MKHVPLRTCILTREKKPKNELVRFALDPETRELVLDEKGNIRSRGANLTIALDAFDKAVEKGVFERALKTKLSSDNIDSVRKDFEKFIEKLNFRKGRKVVSVRVKGSNISLD